VLLFNFSLFIYGNGTNEGNLDRVIDTQGQYLLEQIPPNSILAIIGISSGSEDLSKYITEGLTSYIMNNNVKNIKIVERTAMPILQREINFQYSGAIDDKFMISIGKMVGANTVVAGTIYSIGSDLRFNIRVVEIETTFVLASNGIDFDADKKVKSLLNGEKVEETLSREKIPERRSDGSISKANQELRKNQKEAVDFFLRDFIDREPRWLIGYNYFPDFPISMEGGYLRNGLGCYFGMGFGPGMDFSYSFNYTGETAGILNFYFGVAYPLYFNWLWIAVGGEVYMITIAEYEYYYIDGYSFDIDIGFNPSVGLYLWFKRFYFTVKYRYLFYGNEKSSFMLGTGIGL
jgi:TolB-like protein